MTLAELVARWRTDAGLLEVHGADQAAATARLHADQLEEALRIHAEELLDPVQAQEVSGYSKRRLRELAGEGKLANHGSKGAPRYRRADLPRKARGTGGAGFDPGAEARVILGGGR